MECYGARLLVGGVVREEKIPTHKSYVLTKHGSRWVIHQNDDMSKREGEKWWVELVGKYGWGGKENIPTQLHSHTH